MAAAKAAASSAGRRAAAIDWSKGVVIRGGGVAATIGAIKRTRGPNKQPTKAQVAIRLDPDVVSAFRAGGPGWQTRLNAALKDWLASQLPRNAPRTARRLRSCAGPSIAAETQRCAGKPVPKAQGKLLPFDAARYLTDDAAVAEYMTAVLETNDPDLLLLALGDVARARGMAQVAKDAGLGRESLYKALAPGAKPRFDTVLKVARALGVKLTAQPA